MEQKQHKVLFKSKKQWLVKTITTMTLFGTVMSTSTMTVLADTVDNMNDQNQEQTSDIQNKTLPTNDNIGQQQSQVRQEQQANTQTKDDNQKQTKTTNDDGTVTYTITPVVD